MALILNEEIWSYRNELQKDVRKNIIMNQFLYFMDMEKGYRDLKILFREIKVKIVINIERRDVKLSKWIAKGCKKEYNDESIFIFYGYGKGIPRFENFVSRNKNGCMGKIWEL